MMIDEVKILSAVCKWPDYSCSCKYVIPSWKVGFEVFLIVTEVIINESKDQIYYHNWKKRWRSEQVCRWSNNNAPINDTDAVGLF